MSKCPACGRETTTQNVCRTCHWDSINREYVIEVVAEDFNRIIADKNAPPQVTPLMREANARHRQMLADRQAKGHQRREARRPLLDDWIPY